MTSLPFTFGISEFTTMPWSFDEDIERYAHLGVDAIEVVEAKLDDMRFADQMQSISTAGLAISGVQPRVRTFFDSRMMPDPKPLDERVACLRQSIERLGRYAPGVPFITNTGAHPKGDMAEAMRVVSRELKELAKVAVDHGVTLALEPLNPTSVNVESAIWTVDQALDVIEATGSDAVGLCLDYWNIWQNDDLAAAIARAGDRIFTVQASDWRTPRSFADRIVPGDGAIPLADLIATTRATGYAKPWVVEIFSNDVADSLYEDDLEMVIKRCRDGMAAAWGESA
ncbi:sugar phosphate isomerase/epimerase family protein [Sphingomonas nostoxanthinifaciens]|uniref:sugar phosphate isomerase/epimerase family protein n=1 Tax=Sphingomonas nostoxanthinifaciens TaxID=2872652 RepID=UPI001CC20287|nr:sugar phosphate isomerase/epimerase family protein [Sphingomonas nostoxanthinifaciens]UAK23856.1 sugar phosphate isomerase/epimerase [Sphingomonas nostoxanthinifaciens]